MATLNPPSYTFCKAYQMRFLCPRLLTFAKYCIIIPEKGLIHFVILWIFLPLQTKSNTIKSWWPTESQSLLSNVVPLFYPKNLSWASCDRQIFGTSHSNFVNTQHPYMYTDFSLHQVLQLDQWANTHFMARTLICQV